MKCLYLIVLIAGITACQTKTNQEKSERMNNENLQHWFKKGEWLQGWTIAADNILDVNEFQKQFEKNPQRWEKAFQFLASTDLKNMEVGKYELEGENLFAKVDIYTTKNEEDTRYEAHRKYADIQYLITGKEYIGVMPLSKMEKILVPFSKEKDIAFYSSSLDNYRLADSTNFFIFFPGDAHRPCVKVNNNEEIKKVVLKVALD